MQSQLALKFTEIDCMNWRIPPPSSHLLNVGVSQRSPGNRHTALLLLPWQEE
jgi:hypothetical protein